MNIRRPPAVAVVLVVGGLGLVLLGLLLGSSGWFNGVEPAGRSFVGCGPAVFGRPDPLPDPACRSAYAPMPQLTWISLGAGACLVVAGSAVLARSSLSRGR